MFDVPGRRPSLWLTSTEQLRDSVFRGVLRVAKSDYELCHVCSSVCLSVRPQRTTRLSLNGFS
jgi:hypothetical protein